MMRERTKYGLWVLAMTWVSGACTGGAIGPDGSKGGGATGAAGTSAADSGSGGGGAVMTSQPSVPLDCSQTQYAARRIWRLTPTQYDNTLHDLLGIDSTHGAGFPPDDVGAGFGNAADALLMTPLLADKVASAAREVASQAELTRIAACAGTQTDADCLRELVTRLGERAFRRPLTEAEVTRYVTLAQGPGEFDSGARLVITAMLQSPYFLYRFELGQPSANAPGRYELDDYEIASELSYMLWQSMPDDELWSAAKDHQLRDPQQLAKQWQRMLSSERARPVVRHFVFDWLGLSTITTVPKDTATYPELTPAVRAAMVAQAERFVDAVMFGDTPQADGSIAALLHAQPDQSDAALTQFYGQLAPDAAQGGMLTLGAVLLTHSRSNDSSPIHRGKLVRERLLCQPLPPPPPGLVLQPPGLDPNKTARERYSEHSENAYCNSCHELMDPIGFAFEHYDGIGRYRADDHGLAIDASGTILRNAVGNYAASDADGDFVGPAGLVGKLESSRDAERCYALEWFRFAYGEATADPSCEAQHFMEAVSRSGGSLQGIVGALTQSDWFLTRSGPEVSTASPEPEPTAMNSPAQDAGAASGGVRLEQTVNNDWGAGYCYTYQVHNTTGAPLTWSVPLDVRGTMNNHWNCKISGESGQVMFTGEDYNLTIEPNGMAEFGFCGVL